MQLGSAIRDYIRRADHVLFALCLGASLFGLALIYSATRYDPALHNYPAKQAVFIAMGVVLYVIFSLVDIEFILERSWKYLFLAGVFIILLIIPFGKADDTGNRSWVFIPGLPFGLQPAEIVKLFFVLLLSRLMDKRRRVGLSKFSSVMMYAALTLFFGGLIAVLSGDFGMVLVYLLLFAVMGFVAGIQLRWFVLAFSAMGGMLALIWSHIPLYIRMRFMVVFDHDLDPLGKGWQQTRSLLAIGSGGLTGMGFLQGTQTQSTNSSSLPARHTDFIFAVCGEELGLLGCIAVILLLMAIVLRCVWVSRCARSHISAYISLGFGGMIIIQMILNIGMCLFVAPVIGLTLPFFSYGGSSILTAFSVMGIVSGIKLNSLPSWLKDRSNM